MLTRVRNAVRNHSPLVDCLNNRLNRGVAQVLVDEGYVTKYDVIDDGCQGILRVTLKYGRQGEELIHSIRRQSRPGRRLYVGVEKLPRVLNGLGIAIVSTSQGVLSDRTCREKRVGGELLCTVY